MPTTTSSPLPSPASYLKLHIPSFSVFQYAPVALCIPLRPAPEAGVPEVLSSSELSDFEPIERVDGTCSMMVEVTANLYGDCPPIDDDGVVDFMSSARIELIIAVFHCSVDGW